MKLLTTINRIILTIGIILTNFFTFSQGSTCANMQPICTQVGANFPASTNTTSEAGNNYGCLGSQPNPAWYYFEIATNGNIDMSLTAPSDIDFIIWGPFANLAAAQANCGSLGANVDCSYSATNMETPSIPGAVAGQVYIMLITNFANINQNISLTQTGGTGSTNCNIVNPCAISNFTANIGPCISPGNTYNVTGQITYAYPPSSGNLIVPVIKGANQLSIVGLSKAVNTLANNARLNQLKPSDTQGGTFTVTNVGTFGSIMGTPLINQPQVAILALGAIKKRPVVIETPSGDAILVRHMMYLSMSYDHRIVDGAIGSQFLAAVAKAFEAWDPNRQWFQYL